MIRVAITPEAFAAKCAELKETEGVDLNETSGQVSKDGVTAEYSYDGVGVLTVTILRKPFPFSMAFCVEKLTAWLESN